MKLKERTKSILSKLNSHFLPFKVQSFSINDMSFLRHMNRDIFVCYVMKQGKILNIFI